ncbi:hypothetical protein PVAP13_9NG159046 [Panicum virgatum]|uniref:Uncharacterized protein n=1 Tax=Panicum virgatum TaxID=38727 RepID=A0A8T0MFM2_PANVG|nr:hypothetical protein PVAP13_9NG159046 [Panicum virgatum]
MSVRVIVKKEATGSCGGHTAKSLPPTSPSRAAKLSQGDGWGWIFFIPEAGRRKKKQQRRECGSNTERLSLLYFPFGIVILGSDFVPILGGREGVGFLSPLFFSPLLTSPHRPLLPRLSIGSGPVTAIAAVLPCPPRGAHHQSDSEAIFILPGC